MLTRKQFHRYIEEKRKYYQKTQALYQLGVEHNDTLADYLDDLVLSLAFNHLQKEMIVWWLYDSPDGITGQVNAEYSRIYCEKTGEKIGKLLTVDALYDYLDTRRVTQNRPKDTCEHITNQPCIDATLDANLDRLIASIDTVGDEI
jgi:hypothetical protein